MQLIKTETHKAIRHKGSVAQFEEYTKTRYSSPEAVNASQKNGWLTSRKLRATNKGC